MNTFNKNTFMANVPVGIAGPQQKVLGSFAETLTAQIGSIAQGAVAQPQAGVTIDEIVHTANQLQAQINTLVQSNNWKAGSAY